MSDHHFEGVCPECDKHISVKITAYSKIEYQICPNCDRIFAAKFTNNPETSNEVREAGVEYLHLYKLVLEEEVTKVAELHDKNIGHIHTVSTWFRRHPNYYGRLDPSTDKFDVECPECQTINDCMVGFRKQETHLHVCIGCNNMFVTRVDEAPTADHIDISIWRVREKVDKIKLNR